MATRHVQRRFLSLIAWRLHHFKASIPKDTPLSFQSTAESYFPRMECYSRRFQTLAEATTEALDGRNEEVDSSLNLKSDCVQDVSSPAPNSESPVKHSVISNLKISSRHDLAMIFTCKVCDTRSIKTVCRESYEKGVVVARCGGCNNLHLIADRLGWFGEPSSVEDFLAARGEEVKKGNIDTLNLTLEEIAGKENLETM